MNEKKKTQYKDAKILSSYLSTAVITSSHRAICVLPKQELRYLILVSGPGTDKKKTY